MPRPESGLTLCSFLQEVEVLTEMVVDAKTGKKRVQYDVNYGALMTSGR